MGLFDKLFRKTDAENSEPVADPAKIAETAPKPKEWASFHEWLKNEGEPKYAALEASLPERSSSRVDQLREIFSSVLSDSEDRSIQWCGEALWPWGPPFNDKDMPWSFKYCTACGQNMLIIAKSWLASDSPCKCGGGVFKGYRILPSRELVRYMRKLFQEHEIFLEMMARGKKHYENEGWEECRAIFQAASENAKQRGLENCQVAALVPWLRSFVDEQVRSAKAVVEPLSRMGAGVVGAGQLTEANNAIQKITNTGYTFADKQRLSLAFYAYNEAVALRDALLTKYPKDTTLLRSQACDLDEAGTTLQKFDLHRKASALDMIRRAYAILLQLDRDDPAGAVSRAEDLQAILSHLPANDPSATKLLSGATAQSTLNPPK